MSVMAITIPATKPAGNFAGIRWNTCCRQHRDALDAAGIAWQADGNDAGSPWRHFRDDVPARNTLCLVYNENTDGDFDFFVAQWNGDVWVTEGGIRIAGPMLPYWTPLPEPPE